MKRIVAAIALLLGASLASTVTVGASPAPSAQFSISLQHPGVAESISCSSPIACVTVGEVVGAHGEAPTALRWYPAGAVSFAGAAPKSPYGAQMVSISCTGPLSCVAVGSIQTKFGNAEPRVDVLTPTGWITTVLTPSHRGADNLLSGVSCPSTTQCFAVGSVATGNISQHTHSVVDAITIGPKNKVTVSAMVHPTPGTVDSFNAISCASASSCVAVGTTFGGAGHTWAPLVETMTGTTWAVTPVAGLTGGYLLGVSCATTTSCAAVGSTNGLTVSATRPLVATTTTGTWSGQVIASPGSSLIGVSCVAPLLCRGVGSTSAGTSTTALALSNRTGRWLPITFADPRRALDYGQWSAIACPLKNQCHLVGTTALNGVPSIMAATPKGPAITRLSATSGPIGGGQTITIHGLNFTKKMVVQFGTARARVLRVRNASTATVVTPVQSVTVVGTSVLVTATTGAGTSPDIAAAHFTFA